MKKIYLILGIFAFLSSISQAAERTGDILDQEDYDPDTPYYQVVPTNWAVGLRVAVDQLPISSSIGTIEELFFEKHLMFQKLGILSLGVHAGLAPLKAARYDQYKYGGLVRYQLHVFKNQIIVPNVSFVYDGFLLKNKNGGSASYQSYGPMFGAMLSLGFFDRETARDGHQSIGLNRTYLTLDFRPTDLSSFVYAKGTTEITGSSGALWYFGIRMEFE